MLGAAPVAMATAQQAASYPAAPNSIVGVVRDTAAAGVADVDVLLPALQRRARTDSTGRFRFTDVKPGTYQVVARKIGYLVSVRTSIVVTETAGASVPMRLVMSIQTLRPIVSYAAAGGLSGLVGDSSYTALPGVEIRAMATDQVAVSDSVGAFSLNLKPGPYTITFKKDNFGMRTLGVTIPRDSGRRIMMWLLPKTAANIRDFAKSQDMTLRLAQRSPVWSRIWSRDDITESKAEELQLLVGRTAHGDLSDCEAILDNGTRLALWAIEPNDVEMMEVYARPAGNSASARLRGGGGANARTPPGSAASCPMVYVWLRN